jgi:hypothetical protein
MTGINMGRVLIGGVVAGLVINVGEYVLNIFVFKKEMEVALSRMNLPPVEGAQIAVFVMLAFALGIATVWLYAAIRPRFGAGASTAMCAGATVWFLACVYPSTGMMIMDMFPMSSTAIALGWRLPEMLAGAVAGAWLYRE